MPDGWISLAAATAATMIGVALVKLVVADVTLIGIDDANITQVYAKNIAAGLGYVFYAGDERVEGSTSFLCTMLNFVLFKAIPFPETGIFIMCFGLAVLASYHAILLTLRLCLFADLPHQPAIAITSVLLAASPTFYLWSVWSLMDVAIWIVCVFWLLRILLDAVITDGEGKPPHFLLALSGAGVVLARPEGIAVAVGLITATACIHLGATRSFSARFQWRMAAMLTVALVTFCVITGFRLAYFGVPFPNTFYAKVSSDRIHSMLDGARYFGGFLFRTPWMLAGILCWFLAGGWATTVLVRAKQAAWHLPAAVLLITVMVAEFTVMYVVLGGDHFAYFRFYQPLLPICLIPLVLCAVYCTDRLLPATAMLRHLALAVLVVAALVRGVEHLSVTGANPRARLAGQAGVAA
jgi:hypothetical protein